MESPGSCWDYVFNKRHFEVIVGGKIGNIIRSIDYYSFQDLGLESLNAFDVRGFYCPSKFNSIWTYGISMYYSKLNI